MSVTVDTNVLVYASNESDPAHGTALALLEELAAGPGLVYLFWPTIMGYLRIVTHPALLPAPASFATARTNVAALLGRPHVRVAGEGPDFWAGFLAASSPSQRGNDIPDAHLAGLMVEHGVGVIYTRDRDFVRFAGIEVRNPFD